MKRCTGCLVEKPLAEFSPRHDGHTEKRIRPSYRPRLACTRVACIART